MQRLAHVSRISDMAAYLGIPTEQLQAIIDRGDLRIVPASQEPLMRIGELPSPRVLALDQSSPQIDGAGDEQRCPRLSHDLTTVT